MTTRRGFLKAILAAGVAPYVSTVAGTENETCDPLADLPKTMHRGRECIAVGSTLFVGPFTAEEREHIRSCAREYCASSWQRRAA